MFLVYIYIYIEKHAALTTFYRGVQMADRELESHGVMT